ncbi:MAG: hypothetical protein A3G08_03490 [Candidatus Magasanikbacteria bacterium RIFCSPLOWO2_12_FULL_47_9b]|nr:MAG: hypothetical protein A3I74_01215 [Candidatus Magasanikbacteria bacterium RIFCSPLOWO2_02_FULL_47_16]OGH79937.1 MAG: hypothetical protein A3C10_02010 [Candidatus Magasanikbacteria bacterium RIFCSPHIGHO2_02_FULL_48_18]OGH82949.1 MAG: hypothetical protein A3G08_03490 [Candidatus Magasanikbacteria bacterium RIFCSPLOWO2_12_FULL_47_9b]
MRKSQKKTQDPRPKKQKAKTSSTPHRVSPEKYETRETREKKQDIKRGDTLFIKYGRAGNAEKKARTKKKKTF